jgi:plastocyanin
VTAASPTGTERKTGAPGAAREVAARALIVAALLASGRGASADQELRGRISGDRSAPAVVYADDLPDEVAAPQTRATMTQLHLHFSPQLLPVLQGTTVEFVNYDASAHNVFSPSPPDTFDLGLFGEGTRSHVFRSPGPHVILCNVHLEMVAWVLVLRNAAFAAVSEEGRFSLKLPPGRHTLVLWRPRERDLVREVDTATAAADLDWVLPPRRP